MNPQQLQQPVAIQIPAPQAQVHSFLIESPPSYIEESITRAKRQKLSYTSRQLALSHDVTLPEEFALRNVVAFPELSQVLRLVAASAVRQVDWQHMNALPPNLNQQRIQQHALKPEETIANHFSTQVVKPAIRLASFLISHNPTTSLFSWHLDCDPQTGRSLALLRLPAFGTRAQPCFTNNAIIHRALEQSEALRYPHPLLVYAFKSRVFADEEVEQAIATICGNETPYQPYCYSPEIEQSTIKERSKALENHPQTGPGPDAKQPLFGFIQQHAVAVPNSPPAIVIPPRNAGTHVLQTPQERAHLTLQHAWKQGVIQDTTFVVINMGNKEIIGYRHRETGTLFLSNPITLHASGASGYNAILTGLLIAAWKDFAMRMERLNNAVCVDTIRIETEEERLACQRIKHRYWNAPQIIPVPDPRLVALEAFLERLPIPEYLFIIPSIRVKINESSNATSQVWTRGLDAQDWESLYRAALGDARYEQNRELWMGIARDLWPTPKRCLSLTASGAWTSFNWSTELRQDHSPHRGGFVAKKVVGQANGNALKDDFNNNIRLRMAGVPRNLLPIYYTTFESSKTEDNRSTILIAEPLGSSIDMRAPDDNPRRLNNDTRDRFFTVLRYIHGSGHLHGSIREENLYIQPDGSSVYIADFSKVTQASGGANGMAERTKEWNDLKDILRPYVNALPLQT